MPSRQETRLRARLLRLLGYPHKQNTCYILTGRREVHIPLLCSYRAGRRLVDGEVGRACSRPSHVQAVQEPCLISHLSATESCCCYIYLSLRTWLLELGSKEACDSDATNQQLAHGTGHHFLCLSRGHGRETSSMHAGSEPLALQVFYATRKSRRMMEDLRHRMYRYA